MIRINTVPPHTPITVVWNQDLTHYDSTCDNYQDDRHHVVISTVLDEEEYGSLTVWSTDSRPWVGTDDMITYDVPGKLYFAMTGQYDENYRFNQLMDKWFRQVIPVGSQIELLIK